VYCFIGINYTFEHFLTFSLVYECYKLILIKYKMKKILITFICLILTVMSLFAQKTEYYKLLRKAEQKIIDQQLDSTLYYYDKAFTKYDYPFARDLYAATCISLHTDNTATLYKYVELLLKKGISLDDLDFIVKHKPNCAVS